MQQRSLAIEPQYLAADYGHDESFIVNYGYQQLLLLVHKGNNCTGLPKTRDVSHIWDHVEPRRPFQIWTDGKGVFFPVNTSPFASAW